MNTPKKPFIDSASSSFRALRQSGSYLVDKSLFIRDIIDAETSILVARPRRFGKTTNLQMAHEFFRIDRQDQAELFQGMKILEDEEALEHMGRHPVIFLDMKGWKPKSPEALIGKMRETMASLVDLHRECLNSALETEASRLRRVIAQTSSETELQESLYLLCKVLAAHHQALPVILIDEYDAPIHHAFSKGFYSEAIELIRPWLSDAFKTNDFLYKGVLTGILRISKESLFSGLNNIEAYTTLRGGRKIFLDKFGFTEDEVVELLRVFGKEEHLETCRLWYNGYRFGTHTIYNPWSITHFAREDSEPQPWWVNTSQDALIWDQLAEAGDSDRRDLLTVLAGGQVRIEITEATQLNQLPSSEALWSLMVASGYLKACEAETVRGRTSYAVSLPNVEVVSAFERFVDASFSQAKIRHSDQPFALLAEDRIPELQKSLRSYFKGCASYFDLSKIPEAFVHGLFFGICAQLRDQFLISSNPETGDGRADLLMIPRDPTSHLTAKVIEFKIAHDSQTIEAALAEAFKQIDDRDYTAKLREAQCPKLVKIGIAVKAKDILIEIRTPAPVRGAHETDF
jgi:Predicted AAA-ATPase/PD-(D/E)XK nuclease superfamily